MQLSRYEPLEPPKYVKQIMTNLILQQRYRYLKIQKPLIINKTSLTKPNTQFVSFEKQINPNISQIKKRKTILKVKSQRIDIKKQLKVQRLYNLQLLLRLNNSVLEQARHRQPPPFSILDTKDEGDFLADGEKKQYPHFSNVLKLTQIPHEGNQTFMPKLRKIQKPSIFNIQNNCIFKIKQVYRFPKILFRIGNQQFEKIASQLLISTRNVKLLYDLFNDYFDIQNKIDLRNIEQKSKYLKRIRRYLFQAFNKSKNKQQGSMYIPMEEQFISLKEIRYYLNEKRQESESSDQD